MRDGSTFVKEHALFSECFIKYLKIFMKNKYAYVQLHLKSIAFDRTVIDSSKGLQPDENTKWILFSSNYLRKERFINLDNLGNFSLLCVKL